jgi:hypothetical protein
VLQDNLILSILDPPSEGGLITTAAASVVGDVGFQQLLEASVADVAVKSSDPLQVPVGARTIPLPPQPSHLLDLRTRLLDF